MDLDYLVVKRKSVRSFKDKLVSFKDILKAIESANQGPFAGNMNHMKFIIIEDKEMIKKLSGIANQHWIADAPVVVVVTSDDKHLEDLYGERGRVYSRHQAGAAIQTLLLKLTDLGLGSCWVGSYSDQLVRESLGIPAHMQIEALIPIGYEKLDKGKAHKPKKRDLVTTIYWEVWERSRRPVILKEKPDRYSLRRD